MEYLLHILILVCIYEILAVSLDLLVGHTGLLSISQAAFYGLGAYTSALLATNLGAPFLIGVLAGMIVASLVSTLVSIPSLRCHDDYFVIATFAFQMILFSIFNNWVSLTQGPLGIPGIPPPIIFGWKVRSHWEFLVLAAMIAGFAFVAVNLITESPFGRVLRTIREHECVARSFGRNPLRFKAAAFAVSTALAALAGSLYAHYITYIDPLSFTVMESILVISMVIIGGAGSRWGPVIGAMVLVVMPEVLRFIGMPSSIAANMRQVIYGTLLVILMICRPRGLAGKYGFGR